MSEPLCTASVNKHGTAAVEDVQGLPAAVSAPVSTAALHTTAQGETARVSLMGEQIGTRYPVPTMGSHVTIKRQETLTPATIRMNLGGAVLCEASQKPKDKHNRIPLV